MGLLPGVTHVPVSDLEGIAGIQPADVGSGKRFLFYQIRATTKAVLHEDSLCFFVKD